MESNSLAWVVVMVGIQVVSRIIWRFLTYAVPLFIRSLTKATQIIRRVSFPFSIHINIHVNFD